MSATSLVVVDGGGVFISGSRPRHIRAMQRVMAVPPLTSRLSSFMKLYTTEQNLLNRFQHFRTFAAIIQKTGILGRVGINNTHPSRQAFIPALPAILEISPLAVVDEDSQVVYWANTTDMTDANIREELRIRVHGAARVRGYGSVSDGISISKLHDHDSYMLSASPNDIKSGHYDNLN
jgi:hypothetical protein